MLSMKRIFDYMAAALCSVALFSACTEELGSEPGTDGTPVATVYQYEVADSLNPDNDTRIRVMTNAAARETYYLAELVSEKDARKMSDAQYAEYVTQHGTKVNVGASGSADLFVKDLHGEYAITVVAANGGARTMQTVRFDGLDYKPYGKGTVTSSFFGSTREVDVEYSSVGNRYRVKDFWGLGKGFAFSVDGASVKVYPTAIPTGYVHKTYGDVTANDEKASTYDAEKKTFTFVLKFTVSAGSFGVSNETLTLSK